MIESIISFLIGLCIFAIVIYLIIWVLGAIGINLPPKVIQLFWVIVMLVAVLMLVKMIGPHIATLKFATFGAKSLWS